MSPGVAMSLPQVMLIAGDGLTLIKRISMDPAKRLGVRLNHSDPACSSVPRVCTEAEPTDFERA